MIVVDASTLVSAVLKPDSVPEQPVLWAEDVDLFALSAAVDAEISEVLNRPKFTRAIPAARPQHFLQPLRNEAFGSSHPHASPAVETQRTAYIWNLPLLLAPRRSSAATTAF
jgi:predicted nucleic acid-binding protein